MENNLCSDGTKRVYTKIVVIIAHGVSNTTYIYQKLMNEG